MSMSTEYKRRGHLLLSTVLLLVAASAIAVPPLPPGPKELQAVTATKSEVRLRWTAVSGATAYVVERGVQQTFTALATVQKPEAADTKITPFGTYRYHVRAKLPQGLSAPSNTVTVGPPPTGFSVPVPAPAGREKDFGWYVSLGLNTNEDPVIAYVFNDPNKDTNPDDSVLCAVGWDRARYRWRPPFSIDTVGQTDVNPGNQVAMARDTGTNSLGIVYQKANSEIRLALSDDGGLTWRTEQVHQADKNVVSLPMLAMHNGSISVAYYHQYNGIRYASRQAGAKAFESALLPLLPGTQVKRPLPPAVALDSEGRPGVLYWLQSTATENQQRYNVTLAYWRPGEKQAVKVTDSRNQQNDKAALSLAYFGNKPRATFVLHRDDRYDDTMWASQSDDGVAWTEPVLIPREPQDVWSQPVSLAIDAIGNAAVATPIQSAYGKPKIGRPKLLRSKDLRTWTITSPDPANALNLGISTWYTSLRFISINKLYLAFTSSQTESRLKAGLVFWREP